MQPLRYLETERLMLNSVSNADAEFFVQLLSNPKVRAFLGGPVSSEVAEKQFEAYKKGAPNIGIWIVRTEPHQTAIGLIVLSPHQDGAAFEISFQFDPKSWGNGFAIEANECVLDHALNDLGHDRVIAETQTANVASCALLRKLGMSPERTLQRYGAEQTIFATRPCDKNNNHS